MARGWHYTKLSLSSALLSFSGMCICFYAFLFVGSVLFRYVFFVVAFYALVGAL